MLAQVSTLFLSALVLKEWVTGDGSSARNFQIRGVCLDIASRTR